MGQDGISARHRARCWAPWPPDGPFAVGATLTIGPALLFGLLLLVLAEAFRQGERLSQDVEGLV